MCGIFAFLSQLGSDETRAYKSYQFGQRLNKMRQASERIRHRGPDNSCDMVRIGYGNNGLLGLWSFLSFHRLAINDLSEFGNQPMCHPKDPNLILICNGEIYNHKQLYNQWIPTRNWVVNKSNSDCEIILHLYRTYGIEFTVRNLQGYFAFVLVDLNKCVYYIARDSIGVRSLFWGQNGTDVVVASELKALTGLGLSIDQFPPGHIWSSATNTLQSYKELETISDISVYLTTDKLTTRIRELLESAVRRCITMTDRPIGCLLSGGVDSSLISGIASKIIKNNGGRLRTFSIGMKGSTDLYYAKMVANYIDSDHTEVIVTADELLRAIPDTIRQIETCDTTTVRASTPMLMLCKYIKANTDIAVVLSGEGSDEVCGSYMYFHNAPSAEKFDTECRRLVSELSYFDVLRCDKCTAGAGLEVRVPFLNEKFREFYMKIPAQQRMPATWNMEKWLLRQAFRYTDTIPEAVLLRPKEGMSDGVSSQAESWYQIIGRYVKTLDLSGDVKEYDNIPPPLTDEAKWYRLIFDAEYGEHIGAVFKHYWLPKWSGNITDPSARILSVYKNQ